MSYYSRMLAYKTIINSINIVDSIEKKNSEV